MKSASFLRQLRAEGERTCRQVWDLCWNSHTSFCSWGLGQEDQAPHFSRLGLKHGFLLSLLRLSFCDLSCTSWRIKTYTFGVVYTEVEPRAGWERCSALGSGDTGERKTHKDINGTSKSWAPVVFPKSFLKRPSVTFSKGSITLGSEGPGFVCFSSLPSLPPFSPSLQHLFIKCLSCDSFSPAVGNQK